MSWACIDIQPLCLRWMRTACCSRPEWEERVKILLGKHEEALTLCTRSKWNHASPYHAWHELRAPKNCLVDDDGLGISMWSRSNTWCVHLLTQSSYSHSWIAGQESFDLVGPVNAYKVYEKGIWRVFVRTMSKTVREYRERRKQCVLVRLSVSIKPRTIMHDERVVMGTAFFWGNQKELNEKVRLNTVRASFFFSLLYLKWADLSLTAVLFLFSIWCWIVRAWPSLWFIVMKGACYVFYWIVVVILCFLCLNDWFGCSLSLSFFFCFIWIGRKTLLATKGKM